MTDRTVRVVLTGTVAPFTAAMRQAAQTTAATASQVQASTRAATARVSAGYTAMGRSAQSAAARASAAMAEMRLAAHAAGAEAIRMGQDNRKALKAIQGASLGMVAAFGLAALAAARFDKSMSEVRAVTNASARDMARLKQAALDAGEATTYSATQAAKAEAELARAGISTADIVGGALKGSLDLAASGQLELAEAAIISAQAMNSFGLGGKDVSHIADVISAGAGKSATNVHDMGQAFRQTALVSNQTGLSLEQTVGTLSLFAQKALVGSDAGTSLKVMLQRLTPQSKEAAATMQKLGFSAYDGQGNFVGLSEMAQRLHTSFSSLTPEARNAAMGVIFGSDAVRAATILYQAGGKGVDTWTKAVNDSGYATRVAATMTDNLSGDLERLKGSLETALISSGSAANGVLREMAQAITAVVSWYNKLPPGVQQTVTVMSGLLGVIGLVGSGLLLMLPRIMAVRTELVAMGLTAARTRALMAGLGRLGLLTGVFGAIAWGISELSDKFKAAPPSVTRLTNSLVDLAVRGKAAGELSKTFGKDLDGVGEAVGRIAHPSVLNRVSDFFSSFDPGNDGGPGREKMVQQVKSMDKALASLVDSGRADLAAKAFKRLSREAEANGTSTEKLRTLLPKYGDALTSLDTQQKLAAGGQKELGDATAMTAGEMQDQRTEAEKLTDALNTLNGLNIGAAEAQIGFRSSLKDVTDAVKENGHSLDTNSEKGRKVKSSILEAAKAAQEHAQAVADQKGSVEAGNQAFERNVAALKRTMKAAGFTEGQIKSLVGSYAQLPTSATTTFRDPGAEKTINDLDAIRKKLADVPAGKSITVKAPTAAAQEQLRALGFKVKNLPGKKISISVPTGSQKGAVDRLRAAIEMLRNREISISITKYFRSVGNPQGMKNALETSANGNVFVERYAQGGTRENHVAQIARPGAWRLWAEPETGGEAYIPFAPSKRVRSRAIAEETVRRLGGKGIAWYADGGIPGFTYTPSGSPVLGGPSDSMQRYTGEIADLKEAWKQYEDAVKALAKLKKGKHTRKQLRAAEKKVRDERDDLYAADKELGLKKGAKTPKAFSITGYLSQLTESLAATEKWRKNLNKIGARGGAELQAMLEGMGEEGYALVNALAGASDKQFKSIVSKLEKTGDLAKATLADFTKQLSGSTKESQQFAADLQTLAAKGFGALAQALAAQGDSTAMALAHQAATGSSKDVAAANTAVSKAQSTLTGEDLANALIVLSTLRAKPGAGFADVAAAGVDFGTLRALVPRMLDQINRLPEAYKSTFLRQWAGQGGVTAMARGGILDRPTMVLGGEAGVPESWIPHNGSQRSRTLLSQTAGLMGYQLVPAGRYGGIRPSTAAIAREVTKQITVNLYGARQTTAEQARDVARHLAFVG